MKLYILTLLTGFALFGEDQLLVIKPVPSFKSYLPCAALQPSGGAARTTANKDIPPCEGPQPQPDAKTWAAEVEKILTLALGVTPSNDTEYIIHVVKYNDNAPVVEWQRWFVYDADWKSVSWIADPRKNAHFREDRLYGGKKMKLVYAHYGLKGKITTRQEIATTVLPAVVKAAQDARNIDAEHAKSVAAAKEPNHTEPVPPPAQPAPTMAEVARDVDLALSGGGMTTFDTARFEFAIEPASGSIPEKVIALPLAYTSLAQIAYRVSVANRTPSPLANLSNVLASAKLAIPAEAANKVQLDFVVEPLVVFGSGDIELIHHPADLDIRCLNRTDTEKKDPIEVAKQTYIVEKRYHFDFGFALPVNSPDSLTFESEAGRVIPKKIERQNVFGVVSFYPWKVDTLKTAFRLTPGFMVGLPISGKPFNQQLYAVSFGLWKLELFAGLTSIRTLRPSDASVAPADLRSHWNFKGAFGVNVPVKTVIDALKPRK